MTENLGFAMSDNDARLMLAAELGTLQQQVANNYLTEDGLRDARLRCKYDCVIATATGALGELRGVVLDMVCRRLAQHTGMPLDYWAADLMQATPDDLSSLGPVDD